MSAERRSSKSTRQHTRELKAQIRREVGITRAQQDSYLWVETETVLRKMPDYEQYAPHTSILIEYFRIRRDSFGNREKLVEELTVFRQRHDPEVLVVLKPAFGAISQILAKTSI